MLFQWCEWEKVRDAEKRIRAAYPHARFDIAPGWAHAGLAVLHPDAYALKIRDIAGGVSMGK